MGAPLEKLSLTVNRSRVLIVDDSTGARSALRVILEASGWAAVDVSSTRDALDRAGREQFDLIITDLDTAPLDGLTFISALLHAPWPAARPKILMCSASIPANARANLARLQIPTLDKPIDPRALLTAVAEMLDIT